MGDLFTWNSLSKIMAGKEGADMLFGVIRYFFGQGGQPTNNSGHDDGTQKAKDDGKGNTDEHNALIALAEAHFGKPLSEMDEEDTAVTRTRFSRLMAIFKALRDQGKTGGAEKLMHIIGHESHLHGTPAKPRTGPGHKPDGPPERIDMHNVRERTNPAGKLIIRFLTDIPSQEAVEILVAMSITDNSKDKTTAAAKEIKDKADEVWVKLKGWYGENDTRVHMFLAAIATNRETVNRILASPRAKELMASVEAAPPEEKRARREAFQGYVLQMVRDFQKRTKMPAPANESSVTVADKPSRFTLKAVLIGLAIGCVALTAILGLL